jgi:acetyl-CoA synthetase
MAALEKALDRYRLAGEVFRWEVPDPFNFGRDVVDRFAEEPERPALLWRSLEDRERQLGFGEVPAASNRFANLLASLGVGPGDPVIIMLPRVPEWRIAVVGVPDPDRGPVVKACVVLRPEIRGEQSPLI